jgi:predicted nucleic acid-binding protein
MRVMIDTNVIVSAVYNPKSKPADADIIVSGEKQFLELDIERPQVLSPAAYFESECEGWKYDI